MSLPKKIRIQEVGPREGFQFEKDAQISTDDKVKLIDALSEAGAPEIEVTSFVSPKWVPQMADAEEVVKRIRINPKVEYTAVYLNDKGFERALATGKLHVEGILGLTASDVFCQKNTNKTIQQAIQDLPRQIELFQSRGVDIRTGNIMAAFGCNYEGYIPLSRVMSLVEVMLGLADRFGFRLQRLQLADTMGWANPEQIMRTVGAIWERWPDLRINLHLHDTRGSGLANAYAALRMGVDDFSAALAGLGGCPFAGHRAAAGNIVTEDLAFMCEEMGIETGLDLEKYIQCSALAEEIVGHPLPGKIMKAGLLNRK